MVLLAAGLVASAIDGFAQPLPRGERPVQRTLPRKEIYANLGMGLGVGEGEAKSLMQSIEDRGFPPRETVVLLLLAKARADRLIEEGKFSKEQWAQALTQSADYLVGQVQEEKAGWLMLVQKAGATVDLRKVVAEANQIIGFFSEKVRLSETVPLEQVPFVIEQGPSVKPEQENAEERGQSK